MKCHFNSKNKDYYFHFDILLKKNSLYLLYLFIILNIKTLLILQPKNFNNFLFIKINKSKILYYLIFWVLEYYL